MLDIAKHKKHLEIGKWYEFPNGWIVKFWSMDNIHLMPNCLSFLTNSYCINGIIRNKMLFFNVPYDFTIKEININKLCTAK